MKYFGALDLARVSGACAGLPFQRPEVETWIIPKGGGVGERCERLRRLTVRWIETHGPDHVFIEAPQSPAVLVSVGSTAETVLALNGYVATALAVCWALGVSSSLLDRQAALKHFVGKARFAKKDDGKRACMARCRQLGWEVAGFDEADAVALWDYGCSLEASAEYLKQAQTRAKMF